MKRILQFILAGLFLVGTASRSSAFSLRGVPRPAWQTAALGYGVFAGDDFGGPVNIGEEFRINVPLWTYGFDASFINYFGTNGIAAVDAAFAILNALPNVNTLSDADLANITTQAKYNNATAANHRVLDLKSYVLGVMVAQMGLADPERFVWALRDRQQTGAPVVTNYLVVNRNFDPITSLPSRTVNTVTYNYQIRESRPPQPAFATCVSLSSDPVNDSRFGSVARVDDQGGSATTLASSIVAGISSSGLNAGDFFTGLTQDDVAGLRYLLRYGNYNIENSAAGVTLVSRTAYSTFGINSGRNNSIFGPGGSSFSSPWGVSLGGSNTVVTAGITNTLVTQALRPGIGKVTFAKVLFDSMLYQTFSVTNIYSDFIITNSIVTNQVVQRIQTQPDILFTSGDLGLAGGTTPSPVLVRRTVGTRWVSNSALNTIGGGGAVLDGPGQINPNAGAGAAITLAFSSVGPYYNNSSTSFFVNQTTQTGGFVWGWFDTTTIFALFPQGMTLQVLEQLNHP